MDTIYYFAINTPWWVYLIFIYILFIGLRAAKGGVIHIAKLFIIPIVFLWLSIDTLTGSVGVTSAHVLLWLAGILLGSCVGVWQLGRLKIEVDQTKKLIKLPGTWTTLIFALAVFVAKYYFSYEMAVRPSVIHDHGFVYSMLIISGFLTGTFVGKVLYALYKLKVGPQVDLSVSS